jgi:putative aldouronate transport system permease protein
MVNITRIKKRKWLSPTAAPLSFRVFNTVLMIILSALFAIPFILIAVASVTPEIEITSRGFQLFPSSFTLYNYEYLFGVSDKFTRALYVTFMLTVVGTFNTLFFTALGAYALSRKYLPYRKFLTFLVYLTMLINGGVIPWYIMVRNLGLIDTFFALFLPSTIATWNLIVMRNSFMALPESLEESAKIDGAGDFRIFFRIILPISKPIMATMIVYLAVGYWNEWYRPMLFLTKRTDLYTLQYLLREIFSANASMTSRGGMAMMVRDQPRPSESLKMAAVMIATVPILCVYPFLQKYFIQGIMVGSIKG